MLRAMSSQARGVMQRTIESKLTDKFQPAVLQVVNESFKHNVPKDAETHFSVLVVSDK